MNIFRKSFFALMLALPAAMLAEGERTGLTLSSPEYDFGLMREAAGRKTGRVMLVNRGASPDFIREVRPSCGCTGADFQQGEIAPGDSAWVTFTYNPEGRPGRFEKTVRIVLGDDARRQVLKIKGTVLGTPATLHRTYPVDRGAVRLSEEEIELGKVKRNSTRHRFLNLYNTTEDTLHLSISSPEEALGAEVYPTALPAGEIATVSFYFNPRLLSEEGDADFKVPLLDADSGKELAEFGVTATVIPDSSDMSVEQVVDAPRIQVYKSVIPLDLVRGGKKREFSIAIENSGNSPLRLINVRCGEKGVKFDALPKTVAPGRKAVIKGELKLSHPDPSGFRIPVEIITDDPLHPVTTLFLTGAGTR